MPALAALSVDVSIAHVSAFLPHGGSSNGWCKPNFLKYSLIPARHSSLYAALDLQHGWSNCILCSDNKTIYLTLPLSIIANNTTNISLVASLWAQSRHIGIQPLCRPPLPL